VLCTTAVHSDTHMREQFLYLHLGETFFVCVFFAFSILYVFSCLASVFGAFCVSSRDWLGKVSQKWPVSFLLDCKTWSQ